MNKLTKKRIFINIAGGLAGLIAGGISLYFKDFRIAIFGCIALAIWWEFLGGKKYYEMDEVDIKATYKSGYYAFMTLIIGILITSVYDGFTVYDVWYVSILQLFIVMQYYMKNPHKLDK